LAAVDPAPLVARALRRHRRMLRPGRGGQLFVLAAGKAALPMAIAAERALGPHVVGFAVGVPSPERRPKHLRFVEAGHPLPDARGLEAAQEIEALLEETGPSDVVLVLLSGGASALLPAPAEGLTLADKLATTRRLLRAGADIRELNTVRKHLSRLKGGGLVRAAAPARVVCLALSDVVGDDLSVIGSGPTVPDPSTYADACAVLQRRGLLTRVPPRVRRHLEAGRRGRRPETPKPGDPRFRRAHTEVIGGSRDALDAAARAARRRGLRTLRLTRSLHGEAREVGRVLASILRECAQSGHPVRAPACLLAAGETVVTVRGKGRGGRNLEVAVAAAAELDRVPRVLLASLATDGVDGISPAAGGVVTGTSLDRARALGLAPPAAFLDANDSESFLAALGDLIVTRPTGTNVADLALMLAL
jgi:hydroxypyruvate reductase